MKALRVSRVFLYSSFNPNINGGWEVNVTLQPLHPRKKDPVPPVQEALWASRPVWMGAEESPLAGFDPWTV